MSAQLFPQDLVVNKVAVKPAGSPGGFLQPLLENLHDIDGDTFDEVQVFLIQRVQAADVVDQTRLIPVGSSWSSAKAATGSISVTAVLLDAKP